MAIKNLRDVNGVVPVGAVRIDRKSRWGNPFHMEGEHTRDLVIEQYRRWLWDQIREGKIDIFDLAKLEGKDLYCWCAPKRCHGEVLAKAAQWAATEIRKARAELMAEAKKDESQWVEADRFMVNIVSK